MTQSRVWEDVTLELVDVRPRYRVGRVSSWRLWTCEPRCRVWEVGLLWKLEMQFQVPGHRRVGSSWETVDL